MNDKIKTFLTIIYKLDTLIKKFLELLWNRSNKSKDIGLQRSAFIVYACTVIIKRTTYYELLR